MNAPSHPHTPPPSLYRTIPNPADPAANMAYRGPPPPPPPPHSGAHYYDPNHPPRGPHPPPPQQYIQEGHEGRVEYVSLGHREAEGLAQLAPGIQPQVPEPLPISRVENGRKYELVVVQQPRRARMCGFGDKDRRPITPPPCVRLIITDIKSGKEVDCNDIEHGMFVLNVDLWDERGSHEVNLVRHSAASPSISAVGVTSYSEVVRGQAAYVSQIESMARRDSSTPQFKFEGDAHALAYPGASQPAAPYNPYPGPPQVNPYQQPPQQPGQPQSGYGQGQFPPVAFAPPTTNGGPPYPPPNGYQSGAPPVAVYYTTGAGIHSGAGVQQNVDFANRPYTPGEMVQRMPVSNSQPTGMFTRNLIGSLSASAFRLTDPDDRIGIWFVLQDLSVRTEGHFRLRFSFVNVGATNNNNPNNPTTTGGGPPPPTISPANPASAQINMGKAPVLAACFSESFTVYSAKKFPGVVESTHLSKCFATQGIKIPIRKDGPGQGRKGDKEFDDED